MAFVGTRRCAVNSYLTLFITAIKLAEALIVFGNIKINSAIIESPAIVYVHRLKVLFWARAFITLSNLTFRLKFILDLILKYRLRVKQKPRKFAAFGVLLFKYCAIPKNKFQHTQPRLRANRDFHLLEMSKADGLDRLGRF